MGTHATAGKKAGWTLAGLAGMVVLYAFLLSALAARAAAVLPADLQRWFSALGSL